MSCDCALGFQRLVQLILAELLHLCQRVLRRFLLAEDFAIPASDLAALDLDKILALRVFSSERVVMICAGPERDAYLAVMRLAFAPNPPAALA